MAELTDFNAIPIKDLLGDLSNYKFNPSLIQRRILDHLEDITGGQIDVVDPSNPFIFTLEASCVNAALTIQENEFFLRKQYPALSTTESDLYLHMSDYDYLDRFAVPSNATFDFYIELNSLLNNMVDVPSEEHHRITIPRNTEVTVDGITFSLQYPISIYKFYTGIVQVKYEANEVSPLQALSTNMITSGVRKDANDVSWLVFSIPLTQFKVFSNEFPIQLSKPLVERIPFTDSFYTARVFYKRNAVEGWVEMQTTHTQQVFDPYNPTAVLKVVNNELIVFIPPVYTMYGAVSGTLRADIYTTKGAIDINFSNYPIASFETQLRALDPIKDITTFTNAMSQVTFFAITAETVVGGKNAIDFMSLRNAVVNNSIGDRKLPITPTQIEYDIDRKGFEVYKNLDIITNRIFIASKRIPRSRNRFPVTPMALTVLELIDTMDHLSTHSFIFKHQDRITIPSGCLFELLQNRLMLVDEYERNRIEALASLNFLEEANGRTLVVNPFHYVLDTTNDEFDLRTYHLDRPKVQYLNFTYQNPTIQLSVTTDGYELIKLTNGYKLRISTRSGQFYKDLDDAYVGVQLAHKPAGELVYGYINGTFIGKTPNGERVFEFILESTFDIDSKHQIYLNNFRMPTNPGVTLPSALEQTFTLLHYTNSIVDTYKPSPSDALLGRFLLTPDHAVVTHEEIRLKFGTALDNLWRHYRSSASGYDYAVHDIDVPLAYEEDVYEVDPKTGAIFKVMDDCTVRFNLLHRKNEIVLDANGDIVYKYRKGDVKLDQYGNPIRLSGLKTIRFMDLVLLDYKHYAANREDHVNYLTDVVTAIEKWVAVDLRDIDKTLLEQTRIFFKPKKSIGHILVLIRDGIKDHISTLQSFNVKYYVNNSTYYDTRIRQNIEYRTIEILSEEVSKTRVSISDIVVRLNNEFRDVIDTVAVSGLGGDLNLDVVTLEEADTLLTLNKQLVQLEDGQLVVQEDVNIEFIDIEQD